MITSRLLVLSLLAWPCLSSSHTTPVPHTLAATSPTSPVTPTTTHPPPTVYLIRHGEKPATGETLNPKGTARAECLRGVFGKQSTYDIQKIIAEKRTDNNTKHLRPYDTVYPLSLELGQTIDEECSEDEADCVVTAIDKYDGGGNILIAWEHSHLASIVGAMSLKTPLPSPYPGSAFDLIWTVAPERISVASGTNERCCFSPTFSNDNGATCTSTSSKVATADSLEL